MRFPVIICTGMLAACTAPADMSVAEARSAPTATSPATQDDGTYLDRVDPLGGQWNVLQVGGKDFTQFKASVNFSAGGFLNHSAGCGGGYPAFYQLDGERFRLTRREAIRVGKCGPGSAAQLAAAAESERQLASFLDEAIMWSRPGARTLTLTARDGTRALLARPAEPHPELAGRWQIESIGGKPLVTERRPPTLTIGMGSIGAYADCNSMGSTFTIPAPGRIKVTGSVISTLIGCPPEDAAEDSLMARAMMSATAYRTEGDRLIFTGGPAMVLRRPPRPDRRLAGEYEACGDTLLGGSHEGPVTLAIGEKTISDNAGCTAEFVADGPNLTLSLRQGPACAAPALPYVAGEPVGIGGKISTLAIARPDGFGFTDDGRLVLRTNRGLLNMCRKGSPRPFGG
jgi:heat shock protein HslJ